MFLDYLALFILIVAVLMVIYVALYIHDIPHRIAKQRGHPQTEAIHVACWLSLFTLHALWPLVFMWAVSKRQALAVELTSGSDVRRAGETDDRLVEMSAALGRIERRLAALEERAEEGQS